MIKTAEEAGFDLLPTTDCNIDYQQNLAGRRIAILVLDTQQWPRLRAHMELVVAAINSVQPVSYREINIPSQPTG